MTDSEKLDILIKKVVGIEKDMTDVKAKVTGLEKDMIDVKADIKHLHRNDDLILDEVERVHMILDAHMKDTDKHTA